MNGLAFLNTSPFWIAAFATAAILSFVSGVRSSRGMSTQRRWGLGALRILGLLLLAAAIFRPAMKQDVVRHRRLPLAVVVDTSLSMTAGDPSASLHTTRMLRALGEKIGKLSTYYGLTFRSAGDPETELPGVAEGKPPSFGDDETPLFRTLTELPRIVPELSAVVLLSDGRDTSGATGEPPAIPVPVLPLVEADPAVVADLSIVSLDVPPVAFIRTPSQVGIRVALAGLPPSPVRVSLFEGDRLITSVRREFRPGEPETVTLEFTPKRTGRKTYAVEVSPLAGEAVTGNNRRLFSISVIRDKTRVLLVAGTPTWDVKFLRRTLRQDPAVDLITFLILRTPRDLNLVPQSEMSLIPFPTRELFSEELPSFDAVIFANFDYQPYVPVQYLRNIARFVREDGGGFIMVGGDRSFAAGGYTGSPLEEILPVQISGASRHQMYINRPFRPRLTESGMAHPVLQWKADPGENRLLWNALPQLEGMSWMLRPKPGAIVLADNPTARNEHGAPPVIALSEAGSGRVVSIATDSLWRWGLTYAGSGGDETTFRDFWRRTLRWAIHDPDMALVRLAPPSTGLRAGHEVSFGARVLDRRYRPAAAAKVTGRLSSLNGKESIALEWSAGEPGLYASRPIPAPRSGTWLVEMEAREGNLPLGSDRIEIPVLPASPEFDRVGTDIPVLERLAERSGGRIFKDFQKELLPYLEKKGRSHTETVGRKVSEIWPFGAVLLATLAVFATDWGLRRLWR